MSDLTYERVLELFAESDRRVQEQRLEYDKRILEQRLELEKERTEREKLFQIERAEREMLFQKEKAEREKEKAEREKEKATKEKQQTEREEKEKAEREKELAELQRTLAKSNAITNKKIADLGDTLGRFAEEQVRADIMNKFNDWNIPIHAITNHYVQKDDKNEFVYEVDILIYNSQYAIALEVKNTLKTDHIEEHLERMKKIQDFPMVGLQGKILLAGVAGMIVGDGVDKYAESKGLFVLKPSGDSVKITNNKKTFKPREWAVK